MRWSCRVVGRRRGRQLLSNPKTDRPLAVLLQVEAEELVELLKLHDSVYEQANSWFTSLKDNMKSQILSHFGHLPSKDPDPQVGFFPLQSSATTGSKDTLPR